MSGFGAAGELPGWGPDGPSGRGGEGAGTGRGGRAPRVAGTGEGCVGTERRRAPVVRERGAEGAALLPSPLSAPGCRRL